MHEDQLIALLPDTLQSPRGRECLKAIGPALWAFQPSILSIREVNIPFDVPHLHPAFRRNDRYLLEMTPKPKVAPPVTEAGTLDAAGNHVKHLKTKAPPQPGPSSSFSIFLAPSHRPQPPRAVDEQTPSATLDDVTQDDHRHLLALNTRPQQQLRGHIG
ncbi:uncharacterized protein LY79DRAFT_309268 [Colletotrichum navitas]|uniref:Uncharacterized protein n=1 Tax=Colletotrichum navitas TaxID=681940 RepID=A0AAD8PU83_9PEZI|nr:uncharacterized protein LY79DRAFT_309268 [Colletotrichum navitas]KAK1580305.1 hypothetical protein LY79DRAFT_309268 [Colletotrichum navitas]